MFNVFRFLSYQIFDLRDFCSGSGMFPYLILFESLKCKVLRLYYLCTFVSMFLSNNTNKTIYNQSN